MQSSKPSKKTSKTAEPAASRLGEKTAKPGTTKSSSSSKSKAAASNSESVARRASAPASVPAAATHSDIAKPIVSEPILSPQPVAADERGVQHEDIARLAYSLWAARGYQHGSPEKDWLDAERQLRPLAAAQ